MCCKVVAVLDGGCTSPLGCVSLEDDNTRKRAVPGSILQCLSDSHFLVYVPTHCAIDSIRIEPIPQHKC